jgi:hypothetical protein
MLISNKFLIKNHLLMKNLLLLFFCSINYCSFAQLHSTMPPEAGIFYSKAMRSANPEIKNLIERNAHSLNGRNVNSDSLIIILKKDPLLKKMNQHDIEAICVLILVQASKNSDAELKSLVIKLRDNKNFSQNNGTETILEYKSKLADSISIIMKNISASQESAINNFK